MKRFVYNNVIMYEVVLYRRLKFPFSGGTIACRFSVGGVKTSMNVVSNTKV